MPCPAGNWSAVGATTTCGALLPTPSSTPAPSTTPSNSPTSSVVYVSKPCWATSTLAGPDWITPNNPKGLAWDAKTSALYVCDTGLNEVTKIGGAGGASAPWVGWSGVRGDADGVGSAALFYWPNFIVSDEVTGDFFITDGYWHVIRRATAAGVVSHFAGLRGVRGYVDGDAADARFYNPFAIVIDSGRSVLYLADQNNLIRSVSNLHGAIAVATVAGLPQAGTIIDGVGTASRFNLIYALAIDTAAQVLYASDYNNAAIRRINLKTSVVDTIAGGRFGFPDDAVGTNIFFAQPTGLALLGGALYIGEWRNGVIRRLNLATMAATVFVGDGDFSSGVLEGKGAAAKVPMVSGLTVDTAAKVIYASLNFDAAVVRVTEDGTVSIYSGAAAAADGVGLNARFGHIAGIAAAADDSLLVVDSKANAIRRVVTASGVVSTLAGSLSAPAGYVDGPASAARFSRPLGLAVSGSTHVFISDAGNFAIRVLFLANGTVATFAGGRGAGLADGAALGAASLTMPAALVAYKGDLYFLDCINAAFRFGTTVAIRAGDKFRRVRNGIVTTIPLPRAPIFSISMERSPAWRWTRRVPTAQSTSRTSGTRACTATRRRRASRSWRACRGPLGSPLTRPARPSHQASCSASGAPGACCATACRARQSPVWAAQSGHSAPGRSTASLASEGLHTHDIPHGAPHKRAAPP